MEMVYKEQKDLGGKEQTTLGYIDFLPTSPTIGGRLEGELARSIGQKTVQWAPSG